MFLRSFRLQQLVVPVLIIITTGCAQKNSNMRILLENLDEGILQSSKAIGGSNNAIYESIKNKCADPSTSEVAIDLLQKADSVRHKTERIRVILSNYKKEITTSELNMSDGDLGKSIFEQMKIHNKNLASIDSVFGVVSTTQQLKLRRFEVEGFRLFEKNLRGMGESYQSIFLEKLNADALIDENILLNLLHNKLRVQRKCVFISPIVGVSSTVISLNDSVEISAGIGYFEAPKRSKMIVDGVIIYPAPNGLFIYKYKPAKKKGRKIIPVQVFYTDMDGNETVTETKITVTVK